MTDIMTAVSAVDIKGTIESLEEHIINTLRDMHQHQSNSEHSIEIKEKTRGD